MHFASVDSLIKLRAFLQRYPGRVAIGFTFFQSAQQSIVIADGIFGRNVFCDGGHGLQGGLPFGIFEPVLHQVADGEKKIKVVGRIGNLLQHFRGEVILTVDGAEMGVAGDGKMQRLPGCRQGVKYSFCPNLSWYQIFGVRLQISE